MQEHNAGYGHHVHHDVTEQATPSLAKQHNADSAHALLATPGRFQSNSHPAGAAHEESKDLPVLDSNAGKVHVCLQQQQQQ
jgi:hypothetical protein